MFMLYSSASQIPNGKVRFLNSKGTRWCPYVLLSCNVRSWYKFLQKYLTDVDKVDDNGKEEKPDDDNDGLGDDDDDDEIAVINPGTGLWVSGGAANWMTIPPAAAPPPSSVSNKISTCIFMLTLESRCIPVLVLGGVPILRTLPNC